MFARAAIVGRVARERSEARQNFLQQKKELKKKQPQAPLRQRCFIPMLRGPCIIVGLGFFLIIFGAVMCNFAFHARRLSSDVILANSTIATDATVITDKTKYDGLRSLTYIGPSLMGLGIFIIIIACVLLLDKRDRILKSYLDSMLDPQQEISMELTFRAVREDIPTASKVAPRPLSRKAINSSRKGSRRVSLSSIQCVQSFHTAMQDIAEAPFGQEIELQPVANRPVPICEISPPTPEESFESQKLVPHAELQQSRPASIA